jgi:hypothetical protein
MSAARSISRMVLRQGICASNDIVRCGQAGPALRGLLQAGLTAPSEAGHWDLGDP